MKQKKSPARFLVGLVLLIIVVLWTIPTLGVFVTSFRDSRDIYASGLWTVLPHKTWVKTEEFDLPAETDPNQPVEMEGVTAHLR